MRKLVAIFAAALTFGCVDPSNPAVTLVASTPSAWTPEQISVARTQPLFRVCNFYRQGRTNSGTFNQDDYAVLDQLLRSRGLSGRDVELMRRQNGTYGTGQSFLGLTCSVGPVRLNKSFVAGRHSWQAILGQFGPYVYLEGDGTETGMKVTGWN